MKSSYLKIIHFLVITILVSIIICCSNKDKGPSILLENEIQLTSQAQSYLMTINAEKWWWTQIEEGGKIISIPDPENKDLKVKPEIYDDIGEISGFEYKWINAAKKNECEIEIVVNENKSLYTRSMKIYISIGNRGASFIVNQKGN